MTNILLSLSSCPGIAVRRTASLPLAYAPASTRFVVAAKTWMAESRAAMKQRTFQVLA